MNLNEAQLAEFKNSLKARAPQYDVTLSEETIELLARYFALLAAWNARLHLVAFKSAGEFATRHVLESLLLLKYLPRGARVADVGSGGGLPIIPCLIARPDIHAVLVESSKKKAVFLRESLRELQLMERANIVAERFETLATPQVQFITSRAIEQFELILPLLWKWAPASCTLLLFGGESLENKIQILNPASEKILIPGSLRRFLYVVKKPAKQVSP